MSFWWCFRHQGYQLTPQCRVCGTLKPGTEREFRAQQGGSMPARFTRKGSRLNRIRTAIANPVINPQMYDVIGQTPVSNMDRLLGAEASYEKVNEELATDVHDIFVSCPDGEEYEAHMLSLMGAAQ